ncbi:hypothetical protein ACU4GD_38005 [Cupriavidus basilensis]
MALARANPGKPLTYQQRGSGSMYHLVTEDMAKEDPHRGEPYPVQGHGALDAGPGRQECRLCHLA